MGITADEKFMQKALDIALWGLGGTKTNPLVGCVIVKRGKIISTGYHGRFGGPHAEAIALKKARKKARGATLYANLEPCVPFEGKKTGPCAEMIASFGIRRIFVAMKDPNPKVRGAGIAYLRKNGIIVDVGVRNKEARELNAPFIKFASTKKPYVTLKVAASLDGKITKKGSKYFSGKESLVFAHKLRAQSDAILVGIGAILADDPSLTTRLVKGKDPLRVILDSKLRISLNAKVLADKNVIIFCSKAGYGGLKRKKFEKLGFSIVSVASKSRILDWSQILIELGKRQVGRLLIEGGSAIIASALERKIVDKAYFILVPEVFGSGTPLFATKKSRNIDLKLLSKTRLGRDVLIEALPKQV